MKSIPAVRIALLACTALLLVAAAGYCQSDQEKLISMEVQNEPLGEVLNRMAAATGYRFTIDDQWASVPVSALFTEFPMDRALKRILRDFDNIIIYHPDRTVEIRVFGIADAGEKRSAASRAYVPPVYAPPVETEPAEPLEELQEEQTEASEEDAPSGPDSTGRTEENAAAESREGAKEQPTGDSPGAAETPDARQEAGSQKQ